MYSDDRQSTSSLWNKETQQSVTPTKVASHTSCTKSSRNNLHVSFQPWHKTTQIINMKTTLIFSPASNMTRSLEMFNTEKTSDGCQTTTECSQKQNDKSKLKHNWTWERWKLLPWPLGKFGTSSIEIFLMLKVPWCWPNFLLQTRCRRQCLMILFLNLNHIGLS